MILESLEVSANDLRARTGWQLKPEGLCKADRCVALSDGERRTAHGETESLDVRVLAERLGMALVHDEEHGLWALGPESGGRALLSAELPSITLPDRNGNPFSLSSLLGSKVLLLAWASWWGCRFDLPVWQEVRTELHPRGLEIVTVALDTGGADAAGLWIDLAKPEHPSLIDEAHLLDELLGVVNVPSGVWIDEQGVIVRPPEPAFPGRAVIAELPVPAEAPPRVAEMLQEAGRIRIDPEGYLSALRDWVANGSSSPYALDPGEVVARSAPRPPDTSRAAASFELGQHLHRTGHPDSAVAWFREAHRLQPDNWTYKRQAWEFVDPVLQGPSEQYEGDWLSDVRKIGAENYYPPVEL